MDTAFNESAAWAKARDLFLDLADLPEDERKAELEKLEAEDPRLFAWVNQLLANDLGDAAPEDAEPERFGPYEAVSPIAVGGMGEVLLGRRSDGEFEREVAIKRLRFGGDELVQRFLRERQTLARLDHEYIARLLDGGTTEEGEPYLVLEYVRGKHVDDYCREEGMEVPERVELFVKVLEAVSYAHKRGVIHRDLKPSNILVREDGQPRLLDFGIARSLVEEEATGSLTGTGQRLFTPEFASPEQVAGKEITPATDIFSLGAVLYTLLADVGPWQGSTSLHELEQHILSHDPPPPSRRLQGRRARLVSGDLDTIVLHCLSKEPSKRFASVEELSAELDRHLRGFPIRTRPTAAFGRVLRHARRNPWQASAALVLLFAVGVGALAWRADRTAASRGEELIQTLDGSLDHARSLIVMDRRFEAAEEMRGILESLRQVEGHQDFQLEVLAELSSCLLRLNESEESLVLVQQAMDLMPEDPSRNIRTRQRLLLNLVNIHRQMDDPEASSEAGLAAYEHAVQWFVRGDSMRVEAIQCVASDQVFPLEERIGFIEEAEIEARERNVEHDGVLANVLGMKGLLLAELGLWQEALESVDECLVIDRWNHGDGHSDVALNRYLRGSCLHGLGRLDEARAELEAALVVFEQHKRVEILPRARAALEAVMADLARQ